MNIFAIGIPKPGWKERRVLKLSRDESGKLAWEIVGFPGSNHDIPLSFEFKYSDCYKGWTAHDTYAWYYPYNESHLQCK